MNFNLTIPYENEIKTEDKNIIRKFIINNIKEYENNSSKLTELIIEAVTSLNAGKSRTEFIAEQGFFKNLLYSITGQNRKIRGEIDYNYAIVKNASVRMIEYLAGQNKITYEGLIYLNNKLNNIEKDLEEEIITICKNIRESFNYILNKINEESKRIDSIEKKVNLLEFKAKAKLLEFNNIKYLDMDEIEKIICLSADLFLETYNSNLSDLLKENIYIIKSILLDFNIDINESVRIIDIYSKLIEKPEFIDKLFFNENYNYNISEYIIPILSGANKIKKLNNEENYILSSLKNINHNIDDIKINLINEYGINISNFDYNFEINNYELIIMIINELKMLSNENNNSIENISLEEREKLMHKYYSSKQYIKAIVESNNILTKEKKNIEAHNIKTESIYKLLISEMKNNNKATYYRDIAKIYLIREDYDNAFKYLNKYFDIHSNNKDINRLKKKLKEQCNKIKKYKEKIDKKIIKETNKDKKEYLEFINDFWALYLNKI